MSAAARFLVGIDLGTVNSAVAYVDLASDDPQAAVLPIPQLVAPGEVAEHRLLPSSRGAQLRGSRQTPP